MNFKGICNQSISVATASVESARLSVGTSMRDELYMYNVSANAYIAMYYASSVTNA